MDGIGLQEVHPGKLLIPIETAIIPIETVIACPRLVPYYSMIGYCDDKIWLLCCVCTLVLFMKRNTNFLNQAPTPYKQNKNKDKRQPQQKQLVSLQGNPFPVHPTNANVWLC